MDTETSAQETSYRRGQNRKTIWLSILTMYKNKMFDVLVLYVIYNMLDLNSFGVDCKNGE